MNQTVNFKNLLFQRFGIRSNVADDRYHDFFMSYNHFYRYKMNQSTSQSMDLNRFICYNFSLMTVELILELDEIYQNFAAEAIIRHVLDCANDFDKQHGLSILQEYMNSYSKDYSHTKSLIRTIQVIYEQKYDDDDITEIVTILSPHLNTKALHEYIALSDKAYLVDLLCCNAKIKS